MLRASSVYHVNVFRKSRDVQIWAYMITKRYGRVTFRDRLIKNKAAMDFLADMAGKPRMDIEIPPAPKKRQPSKQSTLPLERDVMKEIILALRADELVAFVWREQSGVFEDGGHIIRVGFVGKPDLIGMLVDGRFFAIEVKRPGGKATAEQTLVLNTIRQKNGIAGIAQSAEEALAIIHSK